MSDFFRIPVNPDLFRRTTQDLAALVHEAEDTDDDILSMQIQSELERRARDLPNIAWMDLFRENYIRLHDPKLRRAAIAKVRST